MEGGCALFSKPMIFKTEVDGEINGKRFKVLGDGTAPGGGDFTIHAYCESGELPMSWVALSPALTYGFPMLFHYPNGITHFCQETFPEGMTMDRVASFENDGTITTHHTYELDNGCIKAKVSLKGDGFDPSGPTMSKSFIQMMPSTNHCFPEDDHVRMNTINCVQKSDGSFQQQTIDTHFRAAGARKVKLPLYHVIDIQVILMKDESDKRDHIVVREIGKARDPWMARSVLSA
uniref:Fluorescent protein 4 n=1 Tax=Olindias formosus TaxID=1495449 RepID=A0A5A4MJH3_9CNID|nr:fluorescent protein 4 [Olindias formosus]